MSLLVIGGTGTLGTELNKISPQSLFPTQLELDITKQELIDPYIATHNPSVIILAASVAHHLSIESNPRSAIEVNIKGSANIALACLERRIRLVYISTDYVYKGDRGNYQESDEVLPSNPYAWTKLGGEASVRMVPNHLIIRTSFGPRGSSKSSSQYRCCGGDPCGQMNPSKHVSSPTTVGFPASQGTARSQRSVTRSVAKI